MSYRCLNSRPFTSRKPSSRDRASCQHGETHIASSKGLPPLQGLSLTSDVGFRYKALTENDEAHHIRARHHDPTAQCPQTAPRHPGCGLGEHSAGNNIIDCIISFLPIFLYPCYVWIGLSCCHWFPCIRSLLTLFHHPFSLFQIRLSFCEKTFYIS